METRIKEIYIDDKDPYHWVMYEGKSTLMPILYETILEVVEDNLEEKIAARVHFTINDIPKSMDFIVHQDMIGDTIEKVFEWAIENEEYEWCSKLKTIEGY